MPLEKIAQLIQNDPCPMASMILISVLAGLTILCLVLVIRMILGQSKDQTSAAASKATQISTALTEFQSAQTRQLGEVLGRHSADLQQVLSAQSQYIGQFLNGPTIQADSPTHQQPEPPDLDLADPLNWSLEDQMEHLPRPIRDEILRERAEQTDLERLTRPSHPIHHNPNVPLVDPGLSSAEAMAQANGSWTMYDGPEA